MATIKKCDGCSREVDKYWYVVMSHIPSAKGLMAYLCEDCQVIMLKSLPWLDLKGK